MGHHSCCNKQKVRRGLWSPEEDEKLINYISIYGHGCWSSVPRLAGLQRCGKSCRLRWINYLRPDLKRGSFSQQEELLIIELHRMLGNRWAQIAKHLPGRTDNEVKNYWNSSIKKKLISHGGSELTNLPDLTNPIGSSEASLPLDTYPGLEICAQQLVYLPSGATTSITQGFGHEDIKNEVINYNVDWVGAPPPLETAPYDDSTIWSLDFHHHHHQHDRHHHHHHHEDFQSPKMNGADFTVTYDDPSASSMPELCEITDSDECAMPSSSASHEVDPSVGFNLYGPQLTMNQMDYMDVLVASSSSSLPWGHFPLNPSLPTNWGYYV